MTAKEKVPSLLDHAGELFAPMPAGRAAPLGQARLDETEFRVQINAIADVGLAPTHLAFHDSVKPRKANLDEQ
ncbi:ChbG/HpnK family deacetylase [Streptomyces sp. NPDC002738]